jgi:dTDP-D-glucose 4,6-dehydratase
VFIEDVCRFLRDTDFYRLQSGEVYNVGFGVEEKVSHVVELIYALTGSRGSVLKGAIPARSLDSFDTLWQANMAKSINNLKITNMTVLEDGLRKTIDWMSRHLQLYSAGRG